MPERLHRPWRSERGDVDHGIEDGDRGDALAVGGGELETDRTADVVNDRMEALKLERFDGGGEAAKPRPAAVS